MHKRGIMSRARALFAVAAMVAATGLIAQAGPVWAADPITSTPASLNFGNVAVGQTSATQYVTFTNNSGADVTLIDAKSSTTGPGNFDTISYGGCAVNNTVIIPANSSCQLGFAFIPAGSGRSTYHHGWGPQAGVVWATTDLVGNGEACPR
jgi:hypothetical protein